MHLKSRFSEFLVHFISVVMILKDFLNFWFKLFLSWGIYENCTNLLQICLWTLDNWSQNFLLNSMYFKCFCRSILARDCSFFFALWLVLSFLLHQSGRPALNSRLIGSLEGVRGQPQDQGATSWWGGWQEVGKREEAGNFQTHLRTFWKMPNWNTSVRHNEQCDIYP